MKLKITFFSLLLSSCGSQVVQQKSQSKPNNTELYATQASFLTPPLTSHYPMQKVKTKTIFKFQNWVKKSKISVFTPEYQKIQEETLNIENGSAHFQFKQSGKQVIHMNIEDTHGKGYEVQMELIVNSNGNNPEPTPPPGPTPSPT